MVLSHISPASWEHPADRAALSLLKTIPGFAEVVKTLGSLTSDRSLRLYFLGSCVRSSPVQVPRLHQAVVEACRILDIPEVPEVFIQNSPVMNAMALGFQTPFLVFQSSLVKELSDGELLSVVGHELAHVKAGHGVYRTLLWILTQVSFQLTQADALVRLPIVLALKDWERKSELSCDRAGLLVVQNLRPSLQALAAVGAGAVKDSVDLDELLNQAEEYEAKGDLLDSLYKFMNVMESSHPMTVSRLRELKKWHESGAYESILKGNYWKVGEEPQPQENLRQAYDHWKQELSTSQDVGSKMVARALDEGEKAAKDVERLVRQFLG